MIEGPAKNAGSGTAVKITANFLRAVRILAGVATIDEFVIKKSKLWVCTVV
uniref:Uncharacterized protein n=1 Tax=Physcomitrium patens TaxID=3218 RepID=A0A2K1JBX5_PHYPA|nr:hypothetical protein PHYPA_019313 [Physcomitrium patens]